MWKIIVGFVAFAGLALWVLMNSGPVDIGGEHAAQEAMHKNAPPATASAPTGATTAPAGAATKP